MLRLHAIRVAKRSIVSACRISANSPGPTQLLSISIVRMRDDENREYGSAHLAVPMLDPASAFSCHLIPVHRRHGSYHFSAIGQHAFFDVRPQRAGLVCRSEIDRPRDGERGLRRGDLIHEFQCCTPRFGTFDEAYKVEIAAQTFLWHHDAERHSLVDESVNPTAPKRGGPDLAPLQQIVQLDRR